tara:strand:+ start:54 stop:500 length:447 start_codon:yes stop_codon:yes gene_type:complete
MNKKKKIFPVFTRMKFVDVAKYVEPTFTHNKMTNGYAVGIGERNGQQFTFLIPFEEFPKEKIAKFVGGDLNVKPTESGLRTSLAMQDIEDLKGSQELIAVNLQNLENRLNKKFDQMEEWLILLDQDLNKFREVFKVWNSYESQSLQTD